MDQYSAGGLPSPGAETTQIDVPAPDEEKGSQRQHDNVMDHESPRDQKSRERIVPPNEDAITDDSGLEDSLTAASICSVNTADLHSCLDEDAPDVDMQDANSSMGEPHDNIETNEVDDALNESVDTNGRRPLTNETQNDLKLVEDSLSNAESNMTDETCEDDHELSHTKDGPQSLTANPCDDIQWIEDTLSDARSGTTEKSCKDEEELTDVEDKSPNAEHEMSGVEKEFPPVVNEVSGVEDVASQQHSIDGSLARNDSMALIEEGTEIAPSDRLVMQAGKANTINLNEPIDEEIKHEGRTPSPLPWRTMDKTIDVEAPLGGLVPRQRQIPRGKLVEARLAYEKKAREQRLGRPGGASTIFDSSNRDEVPSHQPNLDRDGLEWMDCVELEDEIDLNKDFERVQDIYKAKKRRRKNTAEDDIVFERARSNNIKHNARIAYGDFDRDESQADESDGGLFFNEIDTDNRTRKRPYCERETEFEDRDNQDFFQKFRREFERSSNQKTLHRPLASTKSRSGNKEYKAEIEKEEFSNLLAGIEHLLHVGQDSLEKEAVRELAEEQQEKHRPSRKKRARTSNLQNLMCSDVYDDTNANLEKESLPEISEKRKKEFLTQLIANVPTEEKAQAKADADAILEATRKLAKYKVKHDGGGGWKVQGMQTSLYHHQVQGAAFMKDREFGNNWIKGGLLCDEMGLGKTIEVMTTMIMHRQPHEGRPKSTLIVCPPGLINQWRSELMKHADGNSFDMIFEYTGPKNFEKGGEGLLEQADIVLTSYSHVMKSYPRCILPSNLKTKDEKWKHWHKYWDKNRSFLHKVHFYRVVLDEAHAIKNHLSQTSVACRAIMAKHRWGLTGTPIHNR